MSGAGAWSMVYKRGLGGADATDRISLAIKAIKVELKTLGYKGMKPGGHFGVGTDQAVQAFQERRKLTVDGVVGPKTCQHLWLAHIDQVERNFGIPQTHEKDGFGVGLLGGIVCKESSYDPGAEGFFNPEDRGLTQINGPSYPTVSIEEAYDPAFALPLCGATIRARYDAYRHTQSAETSWDAAIAYWHMPRDGNDWAANGVAPNASIAEYVEKVRSLCGG